MQVVQVVLMHSSQLTGHAKIKIYHISFSLPNISISFCSLIKKKKQSTANMVSCTNAFINIDFGETTHIFMKFLHVLLQ